MINIGVTSQNGFGLKSCVKIMTQSNLLCDSSRDYKKKKKKKKEKKLDTNVMINTNI